MAPESNFVFARLLSSLKHNPRTGAGEERRAAQLQRKKRGCLEIRSVFPASEIQEQSVVTGCRGGVYGFARSRNAPSLN